MPTSRFTVVAKNISPLPTENVFTLVIDMWDDFYFKTSYMLYFGTGQTAVEIGAVKIASLGMNAKDPHTELPERFDQLEDWFFSVGQDREYYEALANLPGDIGKVALRSLRDIAESRSILEQVENEPALTRSLLRSIPINTVKEQFARIVDGKPPLTAYKFSYLRNPGTPGVPRLELQFDVIPGTAPPTNMHVIIGGNGVGKTRLLRDLVYAANGKTGETHGLFWDDLESRPANIENGPFVNVVHVSFSAFDRWTMAASGTAENTHVHRVGLFNGSGHSLKTQFTESLRLCSKGPRKNRWQAALSTLTRADSILADLDATSLVGATDPTLNESGIAKEFAGFSSGHQIVLLTMTRLVELVEERSLVLIDEPETHLHPPLLSALMRAVSELVIDRNGVAVIATHSPVVLQEVPRSCAFMLRRSGNDIRASRPQIETFGESVSRLTSEVFRLDVNRTGYTEILRDLLVDSRGSVSAVLETLDEQLGVEGRFVLASLGQGRNEPHV